MSLNAGVIRLGKSSATKVVRHFIETGINTGMIGISETTTTDSWLHATDFPNFSYFALLNSNKK